MRDHLLIRARGVGPAELRLARHLAPAFGEDRIRFVVDASGAPPSTSAAPAPAPVAPADAARTIAITPDWLAARGLARFPGSGWRCGDYCYYAALDHLDGLERAWLIESDVWPAFDEPGRFFGRLAGDGSDLLAPRFSARDAGWFWRWTTIAALGAGPVHGCLFPITRMSAGAIAHCARARAGSQARAAAAATATAGPWNDVVPYPVPNDEAFVATTLARDGFACRDLEAAWPGAFTEAGFSWDAPLMPAEAGLPAFRGQVLHPVLGAAEARPKLALLRQRRPDAFARRREAAIAALGRGAWQDWAGDEA